MVLEPCPIKNSIVSLPPGKLGSSKVIVVSPSVSATLVAVPPPPPPPPPPPVLLMTVLSMSLQK